MLFWVLTVLLAVGYIPFCHGRPPHRIFDALATTTTIASKSLHSNQDTSTRSTKTYHLTRQTTVTLPYTFINNHKRFHVYTSKPRSPTAFTTVTASQTPAPTSPGPTPLFLLKEGQIRSKHTSTEIASNELTYDTTTTMNPFAQLTPTSIDPFIPEESNEPTAAAAAGAANHKRNTTPASIQPPYTTTFKVVTMSSIGSRIGSDTWVSSDPLPEATLTMHSNKTVTLTSTSMTSVSKSSTSPHTSSSSSVSRKCLTKG